MTTTTITTNCPAVLAEIEARKVTPRTADDSCRWQVRDSTLATIDLRRLCTTAQSRNYKAKGDCPLTLRLSEAVRIATSQESWADHVLYAVPVSDPGADLSDEQVAACNHNLYLFMNAARSANGMAGYGSTYEAHLHRNAGGWLVLVNQRSSIPD